MSAQTSNEAQLLDLLVHTPVEDRARMLGAFDEARQRIAGLIDYASCMALADASKSDAATDMLVNLADRVGSQLDRARARRARARTLSYSGRFREALAVCEEGLRLASEAGDAIESARARLASMHALGELGLLDEAIAAGEAAREAFLAAGEPALAARADLNIGTAHQRSDDPATALRCFDRARVALANEPMVLGPLNNNRGEALFALNDFSGAEQAFAAALEIFNRNGASMAAAIAESNLADVATRQGRLQKAMLHFEHARRVLEGGSSPAHLARLLAEQAEVMAMMGLTVESIGEYERALNELDRQGLSLEAARARTGLGAALLRLGRYSAAETALAAAAKGFEELKNETARARVDLWRAELTAHNGRIADARAIGLRALGVLHERPRDEAMARLALARIAMRGDEPQSAESELIIAETLARKARIGPLLAEVQREQARMHRRCGQPDQAIAKLNAAANEIDRVRGTLGAERFRSAFHGDHAAVYEELAVALLDRNGEPDIAGAFAVCERAKSRTLQELMRAELQGGADTSVASQHDNAEASLVRKLESARAELNALYSVLDDDRRNSPARQEQWRRDVRRREEEVAELDARLATTAANGGLASVFAPTVDARATQRLLSERACIIEYFIAGDEIVAFIIGRDSLEVHRNTGSIEKVAALSQSLQFQISRALRPGALDGLRGERLTIDALRVLTELAAELVQPLASEIASFDELTVVPHGILHALPFHAMPLDGRPLIETHRICTAPSASVLASIASANAQRSSTDDRAMPLVVGVSDEIAPDIEREAALVAGTLGLDGENLLRGAAATVQAVSAKASRASLLHLACHGRHAPDSPMGSGLRLADRWLTLRELMDWRLQATLVTLSGCETGLHRVKPGDDLIGLQRGFFAAGARTVLSSLWRVDDATTSEYMAAFYGFLNTLNAGRGTVAEAFRNAVRAFKNKYPHPAFWAAFVLAGRS